MGAPLVRHAENRVYASAALSFGAAVSVRVLRTAHGCVAARRLL